ncbi:hsp70 family protein [Crateriforma conspicua]|uniref:Chaperone protein HscA n=1 Tax=Crateriforma conspicua TaxID=2527996 RepID=A0A5C5Y337_9PLAN|nr:hsp70 family protein [Crateriforma conspicua]TWT69101.1 Chaperone protein HscA [Crateriforma conspicua]
MNKDANRATHADADDSVNESPRYAVGIDLGTTNCALAFVDNEGDDASSWQVDDFSVPQWVDFGVRESRLTLPSFHYQCTDAERSGASLQMAWDTATTDRCVGTLARTAGQRHPGRRIQSAKSWLSHDGVDRSAAFLPWHGDPTADRLSPVEASAAYLRHLRSAWDHAHPDHLLGEQDVVVTLPASFDEVARELTVQAAKQAGLPRLHLLEEPQAAFYGWIDREGGDWHESVRPGDLVLVCDVGGGTTDLTLIRVKPASTASSESAGSDATQTVQFHRVAVGNHLILGGDNLDLAIAKFAEQKLLQGMSDAGPDELSPSQWDRLIGASRTAKEIMLADDRPVEYTIHLPGEGSGLLSGGLQVTLSDEEIDRVVLDGFFPVVDFADKPQTGASGFQEFGLPYAADAAITRHLAAFLNEHRHSGIDDDDETAQTHPTLVLFNGGVMSSSRLQDRIVDSIQRWFDHTPKVLTPARLDLAVARGAAYYAMVRRGKGVRIAANLGRSYYLQVEQDPPAGLVLIPGSAQPGQIFTADSQPLTMQLGTPVQFPVWVSSTRLADQADQVVSIDNQSMSALPPVRTAVKGRRRNDDRAVAVRLEAELSEIGTVAIHCVQVDSRQRWKLDFDIRSTLETDREAHQSSGEAAGIVDQAVVQQASECIASVFDSEQTGTLKPGKLVKELQRVIGEHRSSWPPSLLRELWQSLMDLESGRRTDATREARWLNLAGYCLRPGYGVAVDDWRVAETWRRVHGKIAFPAAASRLETLILWRRIAGGLTSAQQNQLSNTWQSILVGKTNVPANEAIEAWRLIASLEQIAVDQKIRFGNAAVADLQRPKRAAQHPTLVWSIGRLGSRRPVAGVMSSIVPRRQAEIWCDDLIRFGRSNSETLAPETGTMLQLALVQLARRTGDRFVDLSQSDRDQVTSYLRQNCASEHYVQLVQSGGDLASEEQDAVFGESLPLGIRLNG